MKKIIVTLLLILLALKTEAQSSVFSVADSLLLKGDYQKALVLLENGSPKTPQIFDKIATIYQTVGNYNKAIDYYKKALKIENNENIKVKLSSAYNSAGLSSKAISIYEEIIEKDTSNLLVANSLGKLYLAKNKVTKAEKLFRYLNKIDSLNPNYPYQLAKSLSKQNKNFEMGQSYLNAFKIDTLHLKSIYGVAKFFKELRVKDSTMLFIDKGLKIDSSNLNFLQLKASELYFRKDYKNALTYLKKLDSLHFRSLNTYEMFGMCYLNLKDFKLAELNFKKALNLERTNSKIHYRLGSLYYQNNNFKLAKIYLMQSIMHAKPDIDKQYMILGVISKNEKDLHESIDLFNKAYKNNFNNYNALFQLALASDSYFEDKKIAYKHYQKYIERFDTKDKEITNYVLQRLKEIKKKSFIDGEIIDEN